VTPTLAPSRPPGFRQFAETEEQIRQHLGIEMLQSPAGRGSTQKRLGQFCHGTDARRMIGTLTQRTGKTTPVRRCTLVLPQRVDCAASDNFNGGFAVARASVQTLQHIG